MSSQHSSPSLSASKTSEGMREGLEGDLFYGFEGEFNLDEVTSDQDESKKVISVGDYLPYGPRMYYETSDNIVRMKDIGQNRRILVIGVIGSFTPECWNRHLYLVLQKLRYYEEREVDYICCISTNDAYTQRAWGIHLGCDDIVLMWSDATKRFTKAIGMDIVVPWLDNNIRSQRYVILADDMQVTKMIAAPRDNLKLTWQCEHFAQFEGIEEEDDEEEPWM